MHCPNCGDHLPEGESHCPACHAEPSQKWMESDDGQGQERMPSKNGHKDREVLILLSKVKILSLGVLAGIVIMIFLPIFKLENGGNYNFHQFFNDPHAAEVRHFYYIFWVTIVLQALTTFLHTDFLKLNIMPPIATSIVGLVIISGIFNGSWEYMHPMGYVFIAFLIFNFFLALQGRKTSKQAKEGKAPKV